MLKNYLFHFRLVLLKNYLFHPNKNNLKEKALLACYDYRLICHTFDIVVFIANAYMEMQRRRVSCLDLALLCEKEKPQRGDQSYIAKDNFRMFIHNFALEHLELFPFIRNIYYLTSRKSILWFYYKNFFKRIFPYDYSDYLIRSTIKKYTQGYKIPYLVNTSEFYNLVAKWLKSQNINEKSYITITIRNKAKEREMSNSNIESWVKLIKYFKEKYKDVKFIILPEYKDLFEKNQIYESFRGISYFCNEAVISTRFRSVLYNLAFMNLLVDNGIHCFLTFQKAPYLLFNNSRNEDFTSLFGIQIGDSFPFATPFQKVIWERDNFETLREETEKLYLELKKSLENKNT